MKLPDKSLSWVTRHGRTRSLIRCQRAPRRRVTPASALAQGVALRVRLTAHSSAEHLERNRKFADSLPEEDGFEISVPRCPATGHRVGCLHSRHLDERDNSMVRIGRRSSDQPDRSVEAAAILRGTEISNPFPSSGESRANLTFLGKMLFGKTRKADLLKLTTDEGPDFVGLPVLAILVNAASCRLPGTGSSCSGVTAGLSAPYYRCSAIKGRRERPLPCKIPDCCQR
jgi:hypothetical protein